MEPVEIFHQFLFCFVFVSSIMRFCESSNSTRFTAPSAPRYAPFTPSMNRESGFRTEPLRSISNR